MKSTAEDRFVPPAPIGTPYRSDPADPAPFLTDSDPVPGVPVEPAPAPYIEPTGLPQHAESAPRTEYGAPPMEQPHGKPVVPLVIEPLTPEQKYARIAFWVAIASIFVFNIVLGPIAVFMGFAARKKGQEELGKRAILIGVIGTVIGIVAIVLAALGVIPPFSEFVNKFRKAS
jgi:hypothetical protein